MEAAPLATPHQHHNLSIGVKCLPPGAGVPRWGAAHKELGVCEPELMGCFLTGVEFYEILGDAQVCPKMEHPQ